MSAGPLEVAVRGWPVPDYLPTAPDRRSGAFVDLGPSDWQLIYDTETRTDLGQEIRLLTWQERHFGRLRRRGVAYNPAELTADEMRLVQEYAAAHRMRCMTVADWIHKVFFNIAWKQRGTVIGFNLPFDLSRLAIGHESAKPKHANRSMRGGWSFRLSTNEVLPRVQIRKVGPRAAFIRLTSPPGRSPEARNQQAGGDVATHHGYFVDVAVAGAAMLSRRLSLKLAAELLQTETRKADADHGGPITKEYLDYAVTDTQVTWECYAKLAERYAGYRLDTPLHKIYSEASIGKAHLRQMGLRPWQQTQPDVPHDLIATILETYYGGRTECRIRRVPMPGVATDVTSEYPSVYVAQQLWPFQIAQSIGWQDEDPAVITQQFTALTIERLLDPSFWPQLHRLVLIQPDGDLLPTRAAFGGGHTFNLALTRRSGGPAQWFTYADVLASWLATGRIPTILRVLAFTPGPPQAGLRPIDLAGRPDFRIAPYRDDLIKRAVELRATLRTAQQEARRTGDDAAANALEAQQQAMKIVANSTGYGATIEINTVEHRRPQRVTLHLHIGGSHATRATRTEEPGSYFHPLIGTLVAAGGRLLLALVMRLVADRSGEYVFCDTDSLFIVATETGGLVPCPGGGHQLPDGTEAVLALSWVQVRDVADQLGQLNPYGPPLDTQPLLKVEQENFDPDSGQQWQLFSYSIASKRYAPFRYDPDGRPVLIGTPGKYKRSEHGLGHLLDPTDPDPSHPQDGFRDQWWLRVLTDAHGLPVDDPGWLDRPAVGRLSVSSKQEEASFAQHNTNLPYSQRTRPFNFAMMAFTKPGQPVRGALVAPLDTDPKRWDQLDWYRRGHAASAPVQIRTGDTSFPIPGTVVVQSYRDVFDDYVSHPEAKAAGPDGQPCRPETRGLLQPLTITATSVVRIGKETNRLTAVEDLADLDRDQPVVYRVDRPCRGCAQPVTGRRQWCSDACRKGAARAKDAPYSTTAIGGRGPLPAQPAPLKANSHENELSSLW